MPKKIKVSCCGPIAFSKKHQSPWEDVWLSWTEKPGRKKCSIAHTLIGRADLERTLEYDEDGTKELKTALVHAKNGCYFVAPFENMSNVYTPKEFIDREEAERMISKVMKEYGFKSIVCKWLRQKLLIIPV